MRRVDPKVYTKEYYLTDCTGHEEFKASFGKKLDTSLTEIKKHIEVKQGMNILDVGCGRGEFVFYCASKGAKTIGIDYADASIELANFARAKQSVAIQKRTKFMKMDAKELKFPKSSFDLVIMTGVVEHLYPEELNIAFEKIRNVLKPDGELIVHTAPNKLFDDVAYRFYCYPMSSLITNLWNRFTKSKYPNIAPPQEIRKDSHKIMHINEPTYFSLYNLYKEFGFKGRIFSTNITVTKSPLSFKDRIFNFVVFFHPLSKYFPLNIIFGSDFISVLKNNK